MAKYLIPLSNGQTVVTPTLPEDALPYHIMSLGFTSEPSSGTVSVEYQVAGDDTWIPVPEAANLRLLNASVVYFFAKAHSYRFTIENVSGGTGMSINITDLLQWPGETHPQGLFTGLRAITTQPYTEANVKNGVQFYTRCSWSQTQGNMITAGSTVNFWFQTGDKTVVVKMRDVHYSSEEFQLNIYQGPTGVTGGTVLPIRNFNGRNPAVTTCQAKQDVTVVGNGTLLDGPEFFYGATGAAQRAGTSIPQGRERILIPNTQYLVTFTTPSGTGNTKLQYFLDWYEGGTDLPRNI